MFSLNIHRKTDAAPWLPCFSIDQIHFSNLGRVSSKDISVQNYIQIGPVVMTKERKNILERIKSMAMQ